MEHRSVRSLRSREQQGSRQPARPIRQACLLLARLCGRAFSSWGYLQGKSPEPISTLTLCARRVKSRKEDERRIRKMCILRQKSRLYSYVFFTYKEKLWKSKFCTGHPIRWL